MYRLFTTTFSFHFTQLTSLRRSDSDLLPAAWRDSWSKAFPGSQPPLSTWWLQHYCCLMYNTCHGLVGFRAKHFPKHSQYRLVDHKYQLPPFLLWLTLDTWPQVLCGCFLFFILVTNISTLLFITKINKAMICWTFTIITLKMTF